MLQKTVTVPTTNDYSVPVDICTPETCRFVDPYIRRRTPGGLHGRAVAYPDPVEPLGLIPADVKPHALVLSYGEFAQTSSYEYLTGTTDPKVIKAVFIFTRWQARVRIPPGRHLLPGRGVPRSL